ISSDIGRSIADISTNMINTNIVKDLRGVMDTGTPIEKEISVEGDRSYLMRIVPYLRHNRAKDGAVVSFVDITDVRQISSTLEAVYNSSTSGIMALKAIRARDGHIADFEFLSANKAALDLLDLTSDVVGKTYNDYYGHVEKSILQTYTHVVEKGEIKVFEYQNSNTSRWFEIVAVKMMDGLVITFNDVTDKKSATERIAKGYEELKIASSELEATNHKLEQSNLDLLQFASVASHDLKEPLRKIQAFGNLLSDRVKNRLDERENNYLNKVVSSSSRMQGLIEDILTLSRLSNNETPFDDVDLNDVVRQIVEDLEVSIREKGAELKIHSLPVVKGIRGQMHQLFQNLISNAIKFNSSNPIVEVAIEKDVTEFAKKLSVDPANYHAIYVQDNGIGFDQRYNEKIFGIFQRLEKTSYEGTGIGLAIVKKIVDNHKGFIKAVSSEGEGARFIILIPKESPHR
ncbi:MAG: PAS domain-containing protein, partial [Chitinophagaceae bacterium]|nr:PAS domain-containing protein [Chitinophagaceae bacterium]